MPLTLAYITNYLLIIPLLPYILFKAKRIRKTVPMLPEADHVTGSIGSQGKECKLLFLGESTIAGVGVADHSEGIAGRTAFHLHQQQSTACSWQVVARSGYRTREVIARLLPKLPDERPHMIIIGMGGNDTFRLTPPLRFKKELREITNYLHAKYPSTPVIIAGLPPVRLFPAFQGIIASLLGNIVSIHARAAQQLHNPSHLTYVMPSKLTYKEWEALAPSPLGELFSDGVHPSGYTYDLWAHTIAAYIAEQKLI